MSDTVFIVDASPLVQSSRRPHHIHDRLLNRNARVRSDMEAALAKRHALIQHRKDRLATKMARVHQVAMEQKQRRETKREATQSSLEKLMETAQKNRDRLIQHKINVMSRRVKHAKAVAKQAYQRSLEEIGKKRSSIAERQSMTELRRKVLLRMPRSDHMEKGKSEISRTMFACRRIQRWWRAVLARFSIRRIKDAGVLLTEKLRQMPFEAMVGCVQQSNNLELAKKIIPTGGTAADAKIFLSAFLVVHHSAEIFGEIKEEEQATLDAARRLMSMYDEVLATEKFSKEFRETWVQYQVAFKKWKARDTKAIVDSMIQHFLQLEQLWNSVKENVDANTEWRPRIERQQKFIKQKVQRLGGRAAMARLISQVREMRETHVDHSSLTALPGTRSEQTSSSVLDSRYEIPAAVSTSAIASSSSHEIHSTLTGFGAPMSNEQLAHELVINPDFELKRSEGNSLEFKIAEIAKKAFFDKMATDLAGGNLEWLPSVVADIRQQLLELVPERSGLHKQLAETLDVDLIKQQVDNGVCEINKILSFVFEKMLSMCAPIRDREIREIANAVDPIDAIRLIFSSLENMKLDMANFRLRALRPHLVQQAVEYEKSKFVKALSEGRVALERTKQWLEKATLKAQETAATRNPENIPQPENPVKFDSVYADALLSMIFAQEPVDIETLPETLLMDAERLYGFQNESQAITVVAALMMLSRNLSADFRENREAVLKLKNNLFMFLQDQTTGIENLAQLIVSSINDAIKPLGKSLNVHQCETIKSMVDKTLSFRDTVFALLNRRAMSETRVHLLSGRFRRDTNNGLDVVIEELEQLSGKIFRLAMHNRQVFSDWYDEIIREALLKS